MTLQGKVVAVTGGFGQLGQAVVRTVHEAGAQVAALDRAQPPAEGVLPAGVLALGELDVAEPDAALRSLRVRRRRRDVGRVLRRIDQRRIRGGPR